MRERHARPVGSPADGARTPHRGGDGSTPSPCQDYAAAWTGRQLLIWGGGVLGSYQARGDGAAYTPPVTLPCSMPRMGGGGMAGRSDPRRMSTEAEDIAIGASCTSCRRAAARRDARPGSPAGQGVGDPLRLATSSAALSPYEARRSL